MSELVAKNIVLNEFAPCLISSMLGDDDDDEDEADNGKDNKTGEPKPEKEKPLEKLLVDPVLKDFYGRFFVLFFV